ncbi:MAG TPA: hypothetical protein VJ654_14350 [Noviherbaspirillum sp.]|nr:hypothetical protein [Noviherbaspirillum sp.]
MTQIATKSLPVPAWLALLTLTGISLLLGHKVGHAPWMPFVVAAIIWIKGTVVARYFLESGSAHPLIAWLLRVFVAVAPAALLLTTLLGK